jgi:hypothetical protein
LLQRASEIDATGQSGATVAELRHAAQAAGISEQAFDAALAELQQAQQPAPMRTDRQPTRYSRLVRIAALWALVLGVPLAALFTMRANRVKADAGAERLVDATIQLACLSARDATQRLQALMLEEARRGNRDGKMRISFSSREPRVLQVHASPAWVSRMRAHIAELEGAPGTVCTLSEANTPSS